MKPPAPRTCHVVAVTSCCLGWNCIGLLLRSHAWSRETFGVVEKSDIWSINAIIDFVYFTNAASDILLLWAIGYQFCQRKKSANVDSKPVRYVLRLFIAWNWFAIFLLWCASCAAMLQASILSVGLEALKDVTNETRRVNVTIASMVDQQAEEYKLWAPLTIFTGVAFGRVVVLLYFFVGYLGFLKSEAAVDSVFDEPVDIVRGSSTSLSSVQEATPLHSTNVGASHVNRVHPSTSQASCVKPSHTGTPPVDTEPKRRKPKRKVRATPTLSSVTEGIALRVVPGPSFKRPSYVCSVSLPLNRARSDDGRLDSDLNDPSCDSPASLEAIQAAAFSSMFGSAPRRFSYAFPSLMHAVTQTSPGGPHLEGGAETTATTALEATAEPANKDVTPKSSRETHEGKPREHGRHGRHKHIAFGGSHSRHSSRASKSASADALSAGKKRRSNEKASATVVDPPPALDECYTGDYGDDDDNRGDIIAGDSFMAAEASSEIIETVLGIHRASVVPSTSPTPFLFRTPPTSPTPQGSYDMYFRTATTVIKMDEAVQTEDA